MKYLLTIFVLIGCGKEEETTFQCTEEQVLQECDANGENCEDAEDCMEQGLMCHAEMGHCMAMDDSGDM